MALRGRLTEPHGKLQQLKTKNSAGTVTESHDVSYFDANDDYVNGNRTHDRYVLERENISGTNTATTCRGAATCEAQYDYDARDRLIRHQQRAGKQSTYRFDEAVNLLGDTTIRAGNLTTEITGGQTTTRRYTGNQLTDLAVGGTTVAKYWYDAWGNLDCVTTTTGSAANCSPPTGGTAANLIADYTYDYLQRLTTADMYNGATRTDNTRYTYDALDRTSTEVEDHIGTGKDRTTSFTHQGLSNLVTEEKQDGGSDPRTKTFAYDAYGHRVAMSDRPTGTQPGDTQDKPYTYGTDGHGSVSQLIDNAGQVKASYGYTAYGGADSNPNTDSESLTSGDTDNQAPLNPYRYSARRMDSGTVPSGTAAGPAGAGGYDMGARRFGPDLGGFLQQDQFEGALADLGLTLDPLSQNRYALAGGNPVSYVEWDGHVVFADGYGAAARTPTPSSSTSSGDGVVSSTVDLSKVTLAAAQGRAPSWYGSTGLHDAVKEELFRRLCPTAGSAWIHRFGFLGWAAERLMVSAERCECVTWW
jgi:YD repeat-containing protein